MRHHIVIAILSMLVAVWAPLQAAEVPSGAADPLRGVDARWRAFEPEFRAHGCPFKGDFDKAIISCGSVMVPEDRRDADSRLIRIAVMRIAPLEGAPAGQAIVRLTGGPGGISLAPERAAYFSGPAGETLRANGEIIYFDQRGIGQSDPRFCRGMKQFFQYGAVSSAQGRERANADRARCMEEALAEGIDVAAYTNWQNALDVRDLRRALGFEQWNLLGISYGTQLGQAVMMVDPQGVRSAVLDSVVPTSDGVIRTATSGQNFVQSLDGVAAACNRDAACAKAYPDLAERFYRVIEEYGRNPLKLDGLDPTIFQGGEVLVDDTTLANLVFQLLYRQPLYGDLPLLLAALEQRNVPALRAYADSGAPSFDFQYGAGMAAVIECADQSPDVLARQRAISARAAPRQQRWFENVHLDCGGPLSQPLDPSARLLSSDIPTLVAAGLNDPVTPWQDSRALADRLGAATYVEFPHVGHGALYGPDGCGDQILADFLAKPEEPVDVSCAAETSAPQFVTSWRSTGAPYRLLSAYQDGALPIVPALIILMLAAAFLGYPIAAIGRRIERRRGQQAVTAMAGTRRLSWAGAAAGLGGFALAAWLVQGWIMAHPLGLPVGVPTSVMWAGLLALAGVALAAAGLWKAWRHDGHAPSGTMAAAMLTLLATLAGLVWLSRAGLGPIAI